MASQLESTSASTQNAERALIL